MEHDYMKVYNEYITTGPEYTVDKVLTVDEMLQYTLDGLNKFLGPTVNSDETDC